MVWFTVLISTHRMMSYIVRTFLLQLAQPVRILLNYCGEDFEDKKYVAVAQAGKKYVAVILTTIAECRLEICSVPR